MTGTETDPGFEQDGPDSAAERLAAALNPAPETAGDAVQWFRNGDHPADDCHMVTPDPSSLTQFAPFLSEGKVVRYFRRPDIPGTSTCPRCARTMHDHGWIDRGPEGITVCPGDWVAPDGSGGYRRVVPLADLLRGASPDEGPHEDGWLDQLADASLSAMKAKYPDGEGTAAPGLRGGIPSEPDPADAPEGHAGPNGAGSVQDGPGATGSVSGDPGATQDGPAEYRSRPFTAQAWRVTAENGAAVARWCDGAASDGTSWAPASAAYVSVPSPRGLLPARVGDWVVRGITGEFFPLTAEDFAAAYEPASADVPAPPGDSQMRPATHRPSPNPAPEEAP